LYRNPGAEGRAFPALAEDGLEGAAFLAEMQRPPAASEGWRRSQEAAAGRPSAEGGA